MSKEQETIRELFIEELAEVQGGAPEADVAGIDTTRACCEEILYDRCCL